MKNRNKKTFQFSKFDLFKPFFLYELEPDTMSVEGEPAPKKDKKKKDKTIVMAWEDGEPVPGKDDWTEKQKQKAGKPDEIEWALEGDTVGDGWLEGDTMEIEPDKEDARRQAQESAEMVRRSAGVQIESQIDRQQMKDNIERQKIHYDVGAALGIEDVEKYKAKINPIEISNLRRTLKIDAARWTPFTAEGLEKMIDDWDKLGLPVTSKFYTDLLSNLSKSSNPDFLNGKDAETVRIYSDPTNPENLAKIQKIDVNFYNAYSFFQSVQKMALQQDQSELEAQAKLEGLDRSKIADKGFDFLKDNANALKKAVHDRDWPTLAVYAGIAAAGYYFYKEYFSGTKGGTMKRMLMWATVGYGAMYLADKAGYDLFETFGIEDEFADIEGTSLENLMYLKIPEADQSSPEGEHFEAETLMRSGNVSLKDMMAAYNESNRGGIQQIDPGKFSHLKEFEDYRKPKKEGDKKREKLGHELYLLAKGLQTAYDKTMRLEEGSAFYGQSIEFALEDDMFSLSTVKSFADGLSLYVQKPLEEYYFSTNEDQKLRSRFAEVFSGKEIGAEMKPTTINKQYVPGNIMGYPVVVSFAPNPKNKDEGVYHIFARDDYEKNKGQINQMKELGTIPSSGSSEDVAVNIAEIKTNISSVVTDKMSKIKSAGEKTYTAEYDPQTQEWYTNVEIKGNPDFDVADQTVKGEIVISDTGVISIENDSLGVLYSSGATEGFENPVENIIISRASGESDLKVLAPLHSKGKINFVKYIEGTSKVVISIAGTQVELEYVSNGDGTGDYKMTESEQKKLLENPQVQLDYAEALMDQENISRVFENLEGAVEGADESFIFNLYYAVPELASKIYTGAKDLDFSPILGATDVLNGSIKDYFSLYVITSKENFLKYSVMGNMRNSNNFQEFDSAKDQSVNGVISQLESIYEQFTQNKDEISENSDKFMTEFVDPLKRASVSASYFDMTSEIEVKAIQKFGTGLGDFDRGSYDNIANSVNVFQFYTAGLDSIDIDSLPYPYDETKHSANKEKYYRVSYMKYVKETVVSNIPSVEGVMPSPQNSFWRSKIMDYADWKLKFPGSLEPLYDENKEKPLEGADLQKDYKDRINNIKQTVLMMNMEGQIQNQKMIDRLAQLDSFAADTDKINNDFGKFNTRREQLKAMYIYFQGIINELLSNDDYWTNIEYSDRCNAWNQAKKYAKTKVEELVS